MVGHCERVKGGVSLDARARSSQSRQAHWIVGMGRQRAVNRTRRFLVEQARQAEERGHRLSIEHRDRSAEFPEEGARAVKWWAVCSCGYRSTPRATHGQALGTAFWHAGKVVDQDQEVAKNGVSLPRSVRPAL